MFTEKKRQWIIVAVVFAIGIIGGSVGSGVGVLLGLGFVCYINEIESGITWLLGRKVFDETIYYFPEIPTAPSAQRPPLPKTQAVQSPRPKSATTGRRTAWRSVLVTVARSRSTSTKTARS